MMTGSQSKRKKNEKKFLVYIAYRDTKRWIDKRKGMNMTGDGSTLQENGTL